ncbi:MAG TPA: hypothetical protein VMA73_19455 [Streptosporangiaceae bacterium]|nr:hypothetical protein [Streptosporangiaceae bacterium]
MLQRAPSLLAGFGPTLSRLALRTRLQLARLARIRPKRTGPALSWPARTRLASRTRLTLRTRLARPRLARRGLARSRLELTRSVRPEGRRIFVTWWHVDPARHTCSTLALRIGPDQREAADQRSGRIGGSAAELSGVP